ncbi:dihydrofolate reductase [Salmonirosea aquatica]|uniref:dihydrofolate reductase n=1 Tax=Salmonirosea aquatica TaxID=2654236 RepID=A0A7C9FC54_9BACT|nr:dihydrofolate reductase [Cytophagaceae bacterium SJW1-29]
MKPSGITLTLSIIVAMSENRCIGQDNRLPWNLPDEWAYFGRISEGKPFLMGRKSYESPDGLYSDYRNIVLSHTPNLPLPHPPAELAHSLNGALDLLAAEEEVLVLGGVSLFEELLPKIDKLYLSIIHAHIEGDVFFPEVDFSDWMLLHSDYHPADARHAYAFSMNQYVRKKG